MKNLFKLIFIVMVNQVFMSCTTQEIIEDKGVPTELRGNVADKIRGINLSGYKIVFQKNWRNCRNWACGITSLEIATAYTDDNGNYSIKFNYKLQKGESYTIEEQYYGTPYYPEYLPNNGIKPGVINILNIDAWKPIALNLNVQVLNNVNTPLNIRNEIDNSNTSFLNTEFIYENNITKTYYLRSKPNTNIKVIFWYYTGNNPVKTLHQKTFLYHTSFDEINTLNFTIDCSTF